MAEFTIITNRFAEQIRDTVHRVRREPRSGELVDLGYQRLNPGPIGARLRVTSLSTTNSYYPAELVEWDANAQAWNSAGSSAVWLYFTDAPGSLANNDVYPNCFIIGVKPEDDVTIYGHPGAEGISEGGGTRLRCVLPGSGINTTSVPTNTYVDVNWETELVDTSNFHDNTTNNERIVIPTGGNSHVWSVGFSVSIGALSDAGSFLARISQYDSGGNTVSSTLVADTKYSDGSGVTAPWLSAATPWGVGVSDGDYFVVSVRQNTGNTLAMNAVGSFWVENVLPE